MGAETQMTGAEILLRTAMANGVEVCFTNPGTTEMTFVTEFDAVAGIRPVLGLFEGVCTGAADGYGRMAGKPALTLLHLGPGFANGIANLHNARRARTPIVNIIGDHATWHVAYDAPLTSDIMSLASPVSGWTRAVASPEEMAGSMLDAFLAAQKGQVATLIVPSDCQWSPVEGEVPVRAVAPRPVAAEEAVVAVAKALRAETPPVLFLGGAGLEEAGARAAARLSAATGCRVIAEGFPSRMERGGGLPSFERIGYFSQLARGQFASASALILAGTVDPVSFFGYPGEPSRMAPPDLPVYQLVGPEGDVLDALERLIDLCNAPALGAAEALPVPDAPTGPLTPFTAGAAITALQPEGAIVVDEAATSGMGYYPVAGAALPHTYLGALQGGAIGHGLPLATGAAVACPDRRVIAFQADGSGMYTVQSLWTHAREELNITTLVCSNRSYRILQMEMARAGVMEPGPLAASLVDLSNPDLSWPQIAEGMGVPGVSVTTSDELVVELKRALSEPGPALIELIL